MPDQHCLNNSVTKVTLRKKTDCLKRRRPLTGHGLRIELRNKTRIATFNTLSLNPVGSSHLLSSELEKYGISIAGLTETRWPGVGEYTVNGYTYLWSGCDKHRVQGVALALNKHAYSSISEWFPISSRILKARFNHHHGKMTVIVSYAPTNLANDNIKHGFFSALSDTIASVSRHDVTIALGDYNATISSSTQSRAAWSGVIGPVSPDNTNDNGDRMLQMCATHGLTISNTWFQRKRIHQYTWLSNDGFTKKMIDHILINRRWLSSVRNCRTYRGVELGNADHRLVTADIRLKLRVMQKAQTSKPINGRLFKDHALQARYTIEISNRFSALTFANDTSLPDMWEQFRDEVTEAAIKCTKSIKYPRKPWVSQESLIKIEECRNARLAGNMPLYRTLSRRRKVALQQDQNKYWNEKADSLENAAINNDHATMFREFRTLATSTAVKNNINMVKDKAGNIISNNCDCLNRWKEHYSELLNKDPVPHNPETSTAAANAPTDLSISEGAVTLDEVRNAVKSLKNDRAAGICKITAELLKFGGECMLQWLQLIINCVWISEKIP